MTDVSVMDIVVLLLKIAAAFAVLAVALGVLGLLVYGVMAIVESIAAPGRERDLQKLQAEQEAKADAWRLAEFKARYGLMGEPPAVTLNTTPYTPADRKRMRHESVWRAYNR
jgi:hypothetical protein